MTDTTKRVILPAEATEEMMLAGMASAEIMATATQGDAHIEGYAAMRDAAPNAGKVSREDLESIAAEAEAVYYSRPNNGRFNPRMALAIGAALSALGLEVE